MKPVKDIEFTGDMNELVRGMYDSGGFTAKKFAQGVDILEQMNNENCTRFLSFPACIIATGTRGVIKEFLRKKLVDAVITTTGALDHDLARIWKEYYHGDFGMDDSELHKRGINRLGNVLIPNECYGEVLEKKLQPIILDVYSEKKELPTYEFIWEIGKRLRKEKNREGSIVYWSWKNKIPMFIPGIMDGAVGSQLWFFWQNHRDLRVNVFLDEQGLSDIVFNSRKTGALIIGGGISKHHTLWWSQFVDGLDYAVYITTAQEFDGSLSGARTNEAVSWGKINERARHVTIEGDATLVLPFISAALFGRLKLK
jgi:deoxyhypusine synthase